jgi:AcrR family transcriptional regulator
MTTELTTELGDAVSREQATRYNRTTRALQILEVAIRIFALEGNAGFTQRRIAAEAGVRLNTLQHYFGTRDELLKSTISEAARRHIEEYRALVRDKHLSPESRLDAIVDNVFDSLAEPGSVRSAFVLHCWSLAEHELFARDLTVDISGELLELFAALVGKINPTLPAAECSRRGALLVSHLEGLLVFTRRAGELVPDLDGFRAATKVLWKTLSTQPG